LVVVVMMLVAHLLYAQVNLGSYRQ